MLRSGVTDFQHILGRSAVGGNPSPESIVQYCTVPSTDTHATPQMKPLRYRHLQEGLVRESPPRPKFVCFCGSDGDPMLGSSLKAFSQVTRKFTSMHAHCRALSICNRHSNATIAQCRHLFRTGLCRGFDVSWVCAGCVHGESIVKLRIMCCWLDKV